MSNFRISSEVLSDLCNAESCQASCLASALKALIVSLEYEELHGLAHIVELLRKEADKIAMGVAAIPQQARIIP